MLVFPFLVLYLYINKYSNSCVTMPPALYDLLYELRFYCVVIFSDRSSMDALSLATLDRRFSSLVRIAVQITGLSPLFGDLLRCFPLSLY